jgi:hypothetical protein
MTLLRDAPRRRWPQVGSGTDFTCPQPQCGDSPCTNFQYNWSPAVNNAAEAPSLCIEASDLAVLYWAWERVAA